MQSNIAYIMAIEAKRYLSRNSGNYHPNQHCVMSQKSRIFNKMRETGVTFSQKPYVRNQGVLRKTFHSGLVSEALIEYFDIIHW
jgi:hypothetical protein